MGSKSGFSKVILGVLGLHSGQGAGAYWWAEADPDVAALLRIYPDPDALREVARIIRGWAGEEPRALWERLRAERRARGAARGTVGEVAGWLFTSGNTTPHADVWKPVPAAAVACGVDANLSAASLADRADRLAEVAGWMIVADWAYVRGNPDTSFSTERVMDRRRPETSWMTPEKMSGAVDRLANSAISAPVRVSPCIPSAAEVAATIGTPGDLEGCIVYIDGPYENTTGYGHELPRSEQVKIALDFAGAGATVALSEAEPIPALTGLGWYATEITGGRVGQKRTWSKQSQEIITMNKQPQYTVPTQSSLFP